MTACFRRKRRERRFWAIIDECGEFLTRDIALALDQTRKRGLRLVLAHQHLGQLRKAGEETESAVLNDTGVRCVFGGLTPEDNRIFAEIMYRGFYNLQKYKAKLTRMQVTGTVKERMLGGAESQNASRTNAENWSESESSAESRSTTKSAGTARSLAETNSQSITDSSSETATQNESDTEQSSASGEARGGTAHTEGRSTAKGESGAYTAGHSRSVADTVNAAVADTIGTSTGRSSQKGGSTAETAGTGTSASWSETYRTQYEELPAGGTWSLDEQIHLRSVSLGRARVGTCHIQVQTARPQRVRQAYLGDVPVLPSMTARVTEKFTAEASQNGAAVAIDQEIEERQRALAQLARTHGRRAVRPKATGKGSAAPAPVQVDPDLDDDPNDEAGWEALRKRTEGGTP